MFATGDSVPCGHYGDVQASWRLGAAGLCCCTVVRLRAARGQEDSEISLFFSDLAVCQDPTLFISATR